MRDDFASVETDTPYNPRRLSTRRHVPNLQRAFWMMERERERAVRFSNLEIEVLVDLIKTHILVEAGNLDSTSNAGKRKAWETITTEFWTRTSSNRTEYQLLKKWKNLKHAARKYEAAINGKEQLGPGRAPPPRSPIFEEVLDVIRKEQEALNCSRDITFYPTKVKIKEEIDSFAYPETNDDRLHTEQSTTWEQKRCITSQEEISLNNQQHVQRIESDTSERSQHLVPNRETSVSTHKNAKRTDIVEDEGDASDDAISVGGCSLTMERAQDIDSTLPPETQQSPDEGISAVPSNLAHLVHEKTLALKSAQLALVEKEKKIKDLDIRIREEQLTDIIIRRKHEQELHELRKRRMLRGLSDC